MITVSVKVVGDNSSPHRDQCHTNEISFLKLNHDLEVAKVTIHSENFEYPAVTVGEKIKGFALCHYAVCAEQFSSTKLISFIRVCHFR